MDLGGGDEKGKEERKRGKEGRMGARYCIFAHLLVAISVLLQKARMKITFLPD